MSEHPYRGLYPDNCAPHYRVSLSLVLAMLAGLALWILLILAAVAVYRLVAGR